MTARHVTYESFEQEVLRSTQPTLIDFHAEWCSPCRLMGPVVDELADELHGQANVVKVDIDESPELATRYGVHAIPTFLVVHKGRVRERLVGIQARQSLAMAVTA